MAKLCNSFRIISLGNMFFPLYIVVPIADTDKIVIMKYFITFTHTQNICNYKIEPQQILYYKLQ